MGTEQMLADMLTKNLNSVQFKYLVSYLYGHSNIQVLINEGEALYAAKEKIRLEKARVKAEEERRARRRARYGGRKIGDRVKVL